MFFLDGTFAAADKDTKDGPRQLQILGGYREIYMTTSTGRIRDALVLEMKDTTVPSPVSM